MFKTFSFFYFCYLSFLRLTSEILNFHLKRPNSDQETVNTKVVSSFENLVDALQTSSLIFRGLKMASFHSFRSAILQNKKCRLQLDRNSNCWSRKQARHPLGLLRGC